MNGWALAAVITGSVCAGAVVVPVLIGAWLAWREHRLSSSAARSGGGSTKEGSTSS